MRILSITIIVAISAGIAYAGGATSSDVPAHSIPYATTPGGVEPTIELEDISSVEGEPHTLLIQDPMLGTIATIPDMTGSACFNAAFDLANYAEKQAACLNEETGYLTISYDF